MTKIIQENKKMNKNTEQFNNELKMFINQKLFDKQIISEDMYCTAREFLTKQLN